MSGYVHAHRRALDHPAFRNQSEALAFVWLTMRASWRETRVRYKGRIIILRRGQLAMSIRDMAVALDRQKGWVERFLGRLKTETMIETDIGTGLLVITICNYDVYQPTQTGDGTLNGTEKRTRAGQEQDTEQGREKGKKEDTEPNGSGADAPDVDPASIIFGAGVRLLVAGGSKEAGARSLLGKWRREHGDADLIAALGTCKREGAINPIEFIEGIFRNAGSGRRNGQGGQSRDGFINAIRESRDRREAGDTLPFVDG